MGNQIFFQIFKVIKTNSWRQIQYKRLVQYGKNNGSTVLYDSLSKKLNNLNLLVLIHFIFNILLLNKRRSKFLPKSYLRRIQHRLPLVLLPDHDALIPWRT